MSASEKLKALGESRRWPVGYARSNADAALSAALPQIVTVVEAAEHEHPEPHHYARFGEGGEVKAWECPVCAALTALDEALS